MDTIIAAVCAFLLENKAAIATNLISSASYDVIKKTFNFSSLKQRISKFFIDEKQIEEYIKRICEQSATNPLKPERDVEDVYEYVTQNTYNSELFLEMKKWIQANKEQLCTKTEMTFTNQSGFNIGVQNAESIFNINGDFKQEKHE
jgi:hypothetical protein